MKKVKCECGHVNPAGTVLCESCGKPLDDQKSPLADMRYDGSARRSQTYNKTIVDKVWNFFSSVKVGIWLIVITLAASAFGTVFPQEAYLPPGAQPDTYYEQQYGIIGKIYYLLGFHHLYGSWWYMLLIASIGISLVICSLDRVIPLYRALKNQGVQRNPVFLKRQRLYSRTETGLSAEAADGIRTRLKKSIIECENKREAFWRKKGAFQGGGPTSIISA